MSYHQNMEKGKKAEIEMPPLPQEGIQKPVEKVEKVYDLHPDLQNALPSEAQEVEEEVIEQVEPAKEVQKEASENEKNIRVLRQKAERADRAERERDELMRKLQEMETARNPQQTQAQSKPDEDYNIESDTLVEGKHLSKYDKKIRQLEDKLKGYEQQNNVTAAEVRLKNLYPDFDKVVSRDNIEQLKANYPELAETLNSSSTDIYSKAVSAYTLIKKLGISPEDAYQQDKERAMKNAVKPRPLTSISPQQGDSPLSKANAFANGLTDELKAQLRKEMYAAMKAN